MADPTPTPAIHQAHGSWSMEIVEVPIISPVGIRLGTIDLGFCSVCHLPVATCNHDFNTWQGGNNETLICNLCGIDGT